MFLLTYLLTYNVTTTAFGFCLTGLFVRR